MAGSRSHSRSSQTRPEREIRRAYDSMCYSSKCWCDALRAYKSRWFARFARREGIADSSLREAIDRAERGIIDADLGGGLIKQRVAREGQGRSGGYRMIVAYRAQGRAVFLYAFAKSDIENIDANQLAEL